MSVRDETDQARCVVERVLENREAGMLLKKQAVLFRTSHHSAGLELELTRRNIPFVKYGGLKFLDAAHVKDVLACLRFAENPRDRIAGFRLLQLIPGIGPTIAGRLLDAVAEAADGRSAVAGLRAAGARRRGLDALRRALRRRWTRPRRGRPRSSGCAAGTSRISNGSTTMRRCAPAISSSSSASPRPIPRRERFLTDLTLDPPDATSDEAGPPHLDEDYLILSTIHSAKGQEWNAVFVLNGVDGCIPSDMGTGTSDEIEEERRLLYVAMTRARDQLAIMIPQRFYVHQQRGGGDRHLYAARTRFIPDRLLPLFAQRTWFPAGAPRPRPVEDAPASTSAPACAACGGRQPAHAAPVRRLLARREDSALPAKPAVELVTVYGARSGRLAF